MGANTEDRHLITQFSASIHVKAQQNRSRLRAHSILRPMTGDNFAYDGIGQVEAREVNTRFTETVFDDIERLRRKIKRRRFVVTLPIDASDVRGSLLDPQGHYAEACIKAMERQFDRVGVEAAFADVQTGREFGTTETFAVDGGNTVNATAGLTYEKLLEINKFWTNNEVGIDESVSRVMLLTGTEIEALMQETELTSGDFSRHFVVDKGTMVMANGLVLIPYGADVPNPILSVTGGTRDNVAMTSMALAFGLSKEMTINIQDRSDLVETKQVQIIGELGAVRTEGVQMQKVQTTA